RSLVGKTYLDFYSSNGPKMTEQTENILELTNIVKDFPGVRALDKANFSVRAGEVHGLVGENGAGKSTLIKIIAGVYQRDGGEVRLRGQACGHLSPREVEALGIQFIHQERYLVPDFTVAQSIFLGQEVTYKGLPLLNNRKMVKAAEQFVEQTLGISLPGDALIRDLSVSQQQLVQVAKVLMARPSIIAFDEPTAPLARREVERLFEVISALKKQGITIIYISHYLQEISEICDRVTVLRNGKTVDTLTLAETTHDEMVRLMVGRDLEQLFPERAVTVGQEILTVRGLTQIGAFKDINFEVRRGEVVGLTGLIGSGVEELVTALYGLSHPDAGELMLDGQKTRRWSPVKAVKNGIGLVPKDRRQEGLVMNMSVNDNVNLASLEQVAASGFTRPKAAAARTIKMVKDLGIRPPSPETIVRYLSGGNQQKVVIAKWLTKKSALYLLHEPTIGVDVGAKSEIYQLINTLVSEGAGVLLVSSDLLELLGMSDRILIVFRGEIVKELKAKETTADTILFWATGGKEKS
ncbi:MAG: sugar ABC transporter ATP-binding protein, partial [Chloroflexota bacterium]